MTISKKHSVTKSVATKSPKSTPVTEPLASSGEAAAAAPATAPAPAESLQARVTSATALIKQAVAILAITAPPLSTAQMKAATKFRKGGDPHIPTLADLSVEYGVEVPSRPTSDMTENLAQAQVLAPLLLIVGRLMTNLTSESFGFRSETWATATTLYQMLKKASVRQTALKADLAPLEEFFDFRRPPKAESATPDPTTKKAKRAKKLTNEEKKLASESPAVISDAPAPAPATNGSTPQAAPPAPVVSSTPTHS